LASFTPRQLVLMIERAGQVNAVYPGHEATQTFMAMLRMRLQAMECQATRSSVGSRAPWLQ
jgi:hypothetical protein